MRAHLDRFEDSAKEFSRRDTEHDFVREDGFEHGLARKAFIPGRLGSILAAQEPGQLILREPGAFPICAKVVRKLVGTHDQ